MSKNNKELEKKITDILSKGYEAHYMLKRVLQDDELYVNNKDIIDVIFIRRNSYSSSDSETSPAKLLIATNYGIMVLEEGFKEISDNYLGYKLKKIYYHQIDSFELDICLLEGEFRVFTGSRENITVSFDTSSYYDQFEKFLAIIDDQIVIRYC